MTEIAARSAWRCEVLSSQFVGLVPRLTLHHTLTPQFCPLQVYSFAGISIILENTSSMVRAQLRDRWAPVSLETLLQQAKLLA